MEKQLNWLLVGPGDIAQHRVAPALIAAKRSCLTAICGRRGSEKTTRLATTFGIETIYDDYDAALADERIDAVYIATPHPLHVPMLKKALAAGKHVFCEKPLGITAAECRDAAEAVRNAPQLKTGCSNYRLFTNQYLATEKILRDGTVGDLLGAWLHDEEGYYNPGGHPMLKSWGANPELSFGFYLINLVQHLFGRPESVFCSASSFNCAKKPDYDLDDLQNMILRFPDGRQATILLNFTAQNVPLRHSYSFACSQGRIYWPACPPHFNAPVRLIKTWSDEEIPDSVTPGGKPGENPNWHLPMVQDFVDAVLDDHAPRCTVESAADTAVITEALEKSALSKKWETVPPLF